MTRAGRSDFDAMVKISSIPDSEPIFVLRAQDPSAAGAIRAWVAIGKVAGVPSAVLEQALIQADAMDAWPVKKLPGADHLMPGERKRLEYRHDRRAWGDQNEAPTAAIALAERRGYARAQPVIRSLLAALRGALQSVDWRIAQPPPAGMTPEEAEQAAEDHAGLVSFRNTVAQWAIDRAEALND